MFIMKKLLTSYPLRNLVVGNPTKKVYRPIDMYDYLFFRKTRYPQVLIRYCIPTCAYIKKGIQA